MLERRNFLQSTAAAAAFGAVSVLPASGANLADGGPEAELEAQYSRYLASVAAAEAASDRSWDISESVQYPEPPSAIFVQPHDHDLHIARYAGPPGDQGARRYNGCAALRWFAGCVNDHANSELQKAAWSRAAEIVQALEQHDKAREAARLASGADDAERAACEAWAIVKADAKALATAQTATLRGVLMKVRAIATTERDPEGLADWRVDIVERCADPSTAIAVSAVLDLIRLTSSV